MDFDEVREQLRQDAERLERAGEELKRIRDGSKPLEDKLRVAEEAGDQHAELLVRQGEQNQLMLEQVNALGQRVIQLERLMLDVLEHLGAKPSEG